MIDDSAPVFQRLAGPLAREVRDSITRLAQADGVHYVAVMPDVHLSGEVCVGVALACQDRIFPSAVGRDIGCGMTSVQLRSTLTNEAPVEISERDAMRILRIWSESIPTLKSPPVC